jgi:hypothetical protein
LTDHFNSIKLDDKALTEFIDRVVNNVSASEPLLKPAGLRNVLLSVY